MVGEDMANLKGKEKQAIKDFFPIEKNGKLVCPRCELELQGVGMEHHIGLDGRGTVGNRLQCPKCKTTFYEPFEFRD